MTDRPVWMPPLPQVEGLRVGEAHAAIEVFAVAAVEAYKRSLKPVAKSVSIRPGEWTTMLVALEAMPDLTNLYRLDGGDDDAA